MFERFLNLPRYKKRILSLLFDSCALLLALWAAFSLRLESAYEPAGARQTWLFLMTVVMSLGVFVRLGLYRAVVRYLRGRAFMTILYGVGISTLLMILTGYILQVQVPRSVPVIYAAMSLLFVGGTRFAMRILIQRPGRRYKDPVAIIGAGPTGLQLASALDNGTEYQPAAFVTFQPALFGALINGIPAYCIEEVAHVCERYGVKKLLLALDPDSSVDRKTLLRQLEPLSVPVQTIPGMNELVAGKARINDIRDLELEDLLGRDPVQADNTLQFSSIAGKSVMVTGAGGSIGSELCRQIIRQRPAALVLFEQSEYALYAIEKELTSINMIEGLDVVIRPILGNVVHRRRCEAVLCSFGVQVVYHAAAYKHLPLVELNVIEGVQNNIFGTWHMAEAAIAAGVERFVLISTDKAVRPTNVMGATKRVAELVLQGLSLRQTRTCFSMVRFGNVLGSSGSVVPLFRDQIRDGGPVTVTHPDIIRYFMTIPEASQLVLQAGNLGSGGEVFVLDMGEPVRIADLARKMIRLMGLNERTDSNPAGDIEIVFTGLRPGEKLYEELLIGDNPQRTAHPRIMMAREMSLPWPEVAQLLQQLAQASRNFDCELVIRLLRAAPIAYAPRDECMADLVWNNGGGRGRIGLGEDGLVSLHTLSGTRH